MRKRILYFAAGLIALALAGDAFGQVINDGARGPGSAGGPEHDAPVDEGRSYTLTLGGRSFDPAGIVPSFPDGWEKIGHDGPDLRLVQFTGPTQQVWLDALGAAGLDIVQYVHPHAYVVWGEAGAVEAAGALPAVRFGGEFIPAFRVLPHLRTLDEAPADVRVMLYRGADVEAARGALTDLGAQFTAWHVVDEKFIVAGFLIAGDRLQSASKVPGVYTIQIQPTDGGLRGEMSDQICAGNYDQNNVAFPGYDGWLAGVGVDGSGVIIANVDSGVQENHPDLIGRMLPCTGSTCSTTSSSHGTHTAGIMAADGASGVMDVYGFLRGLGVAPGAYLIEQEYYPSYTEPGGMLQLMTDSARNGASLSGNSWGPSGWPQGYDNDTYQVDVGVRDADPVEPGSQPLTYVLSIMNGYGGTSSQGTPDEAKNIFTIGSTKMQNSDGSQILAINDLSPNSAHGPALDGREIPHMVAPGCRVDSTVPTSGYGLSCGTSMASPHVSGAVALFIEHYRDASGSREDPSPAMIKAAFLSVAHDLAGHLDADGNVMGHPFDSKQGWGRLNLPPVVDPPPGSVQYFDDPLVFDNTGEEWNIDLAPENPGEPMRMMLVWTDAPGHGLGGSTPAWNNNLDLLVEVDGQTYFGNNFAGDGWSAPGGSADIRNNTEGVFLGPLPPASVTVTVVATDINSDGVPNFGDITDQDFALVVYNACNRAECPEDVSPDGGDGMVGIDDLVAVINHWSEVGGTYDVNGDGVVGIDDLVAVINAWGACP